MISDDCSLPAGTIAPPHIHPIPLTDSTVWRQPPPFLLYLLLLFLICHLPFLPSLHEFIPFYLLPTFGLGILPVNISLTNLTRIFGARFSPRKTIKTKQTKNMQEKVDLGNKPQTKVSEKHQWDMNDEQSLWVGQNGASETGSIHNNFYQWWINNVQCVFHLFSTSDCSFPVIWRLLIFAKAEKSLAIKLLKLFFTHLTWTYGEHHTQSLMQW